MIGQSRAHKFLTAITFLSVLAAMGCGNYSPVSPSQENTMPGVENPLFVQLLTSDGSSRLMLGSSASKLISAEEGGYISNGYYSLYFPPGALDEDTEITIEMPLFPSAVVRLGPHGIQFNKDVILSLSNDRVATDAQGLRVLWYNEDTGLWENIGGYMEEGDVKVGLKHFSEYGITEKG